MTEPRLNHLQIVKTVHLENTVQEEMLLQMEIVIKEDIAERRQQLITQQEVLPTTEIVHKGTIALPELVIQSSVLQELTILALVSTKLHTV